MLRQGCNVPDIDVVVQWKLPKCLSQFVQRAGRAARRLGHSGIAILLVERSAYSIDISELQAHGGAGEPTAQSSKGASKQPKRKTRQTRKPKVAKGKKGPKGYAEAHGVKRGGVKKDDGLTGPAEQPPLDAEALDEGLLVFIQTTLCRRKVWLEVFESPAGT